MQYQREVPIIPVIYSSKIAEPARIWLDSYLTWLDPRSGCCMVYNITATMCKNLSDLGVCVCVSKYSDIVLYVYIMLLCVFMCIWYSTLSAYAYAYIQVVSYACV